MKLSELLYELERQMGRASGRDPEVYLEVGGDGAIHPDTLKSIRVVEISGMPVIELSGEEEL